MPRLKYILLANNRLTGPIPKDWFQVAQLEILEVTLRACLILSCCLSLEALTSDQALLCAVRRLVTLGFAQSAVPMHPALLSMCIGT